MTRERIGQTVFLGAVAVAAVLYGLTAPDGLPWNESVRLAAAYLGGSGKSALAHPIWGFHVQAFGGAVSLAILMATIAAGLLGALVNRYFGWRFAASAAIAWIFLPWVWNRAITGERSVCLMAMMVVALWVANAAGLWIFRKARAARKSAPAGAASTSAHEVQAKYAKLNRIAGWATMGAVGIFAAVSMSLHDYKLGEAASVFARGVVEAAGERIIVAHGVADEQIVRAVGEKGPAWKVILLREDEGYRERLVKWARQEWPNETNLWISARVSTSAFVELALKKHPERFYLMNGKTTTREQWEKRWADFKPYTSSSDAFVSEGRRLFGYEGNRLANALLDAAESQGPKAKEPSSAWAFYRRIYEEVDPGNMAALVNMSEMIRRGYVASSVEKKTVQDRIDAFFSDAKRRKHAQEIVRTAGPVRADREALAKVEAAAKKRIAERIASGEKVKVAPEIMSLVEWNGEMCRLMDGGDYVKAGRIARKILSNPLWRGFIPANAAMGVAAAREGDYVASEAFFRTATDTTNAVPAMVLNDYADTLMRLSKLDAAEAMARRAVKASDEENWLARLTLAEILEKKASKLQLVEIVENGEKVERFVKPENADKMEAEVKRLLKAVMRHAPETARTQIRIAHKEFMR